MDVETENARLAWDWAVERCHVEQLDRAVFALWHRVSLRWLFTPGHALRFHEAAQALSAMVARVTADAAGGGCPAQGAQGACSAKDVEGMRVLAKVLAARSLCGDRGRAIELARQALTLLERPEVRDRDVRAEKAFALLALGSSWQAHWALEQSLELYRELDDPWGMAETLTSLCYSIRQSTADHDRARCLMQEALSISKAQGDLFHTAEASHQLAELALQQGLLDRAERLDLQALELFQQLDAWIFAAYVHDLLSTVAMARGQFDEAYTLMQRGADLYDELRGASGSIAKADYLRGTHKMHLGQYGQVRRLGEHALECCGGYEHERTQMGALLLLGSVALAEGAFARTRELLEGKDLTAYRHEAGRHMLDHAPAILACALCGLGQRGQARKYLSDALRLVPDARAFWPLLYALSVYALLLINEGQAERAVELYALASRYPFVANSRWFEDVFGRHIAAAARSLPADVVQAAQERGRARDLEAEIQEMVHDLPADDARSAKHKDMHTCRS